tara:strand:+ start:1122 stop:1694 length:573 start_codon:yes stop_codon:yes gene_type:complete
MSKGVNKVILIGNLGQDPEVKFMPNGNAVANISLATSDSYKDKNTGQMVDKTEWHRVVFFQKLAEIVGEYCRKGSKIYIEGKLQTRKWTDQQGVEKYTTEIVVDGFTGQMQMLDSKEGGSQSQGAQNNQSYAPQQNSTQQGGAQGNYQQPQGNTQWQYQQQGNQNNAPQGGYAPQQQGGNNQNGGYAPQQ